MPAVRFFHVLSKNLPTCIDATCESSALFLLGYFVDVVHADGVYFVCSCFSDLGYLMMCLPDIVDTFESRVWLLAWMAVQGFARCGGFILFYLLPEKLAYKIGFRNDGNVMLITASWLRLAYNLLEEYLGQWLLGIFYWTFTGITGHVCFNVFSLG